MNPPSAILFDFGGTVLGDRHYDAAGGHARLLEHALPPVALTAKEIQAEEDRMEAGLEAHYGLIDISMQRFHRTLFEKLGLRFSISAAEMELEFWQGAIRYRPEPGIGEVLDELQRLDIEMGVVSNYQFSGPVLEWELQRHGLRDAFSFVLSSADYAIRKPHPLLFEVALGKLGIGADQVWYCGNSLAHDIKGAQAVGLGAVWYNRRRAPADGTQPDAVVHHWSEFMPMVRAHLV